MKFNVRDENGKEYKVEEVEKVEETKDETGTEKPLTNTCTDEGLSPDEISALKKLAGMADKLCALVDTTTDEVEKEEEEEEEIEDDGDQIEEVIDTDEPKKAKDSIKKSAGAIEKKKVKTDDSVEEDDVSAAWAKRYGGNK